VRVAYVLGGDPPWVAGPGTYISELMTLAGGTNVFSDLGRLYAPVSPEELVERDIDVVLLAAGSTLDRALVQGSRVVEVNGDVERPGPDVGRSARDVARAIHPEAFP
jgi:iron complex transport system substrate-binding protein